jgi:hypothetical protein
LLFRHYASTPTTRNLGFSISPTALNLTAKSNRLCGRSEGRAELPWFYHILHLPWQCCRGRIFSLLLRDELPL